ncbi:MAG: hypothetical protein SF028_05285 [Candidatus Sumerlaeia bacterium]|nr:hypothetical protein [Candidatus Sumerlaeia bacterium]
MNATKLITMGISTLALAAVVLSSGCSFRGKYDIPAGALPQPAGTYVRAPFDRQATKAEANDFIFYRHMWNAETESLTPDGQRHLATVVRRLIREPHPVVIETTENASIDNRRRQAMAQYLLQAAVPDAERRVIVAYPTGQERWASDVAPGTFR